MSWHSSTAQPRYSYVQRSKDDLQEDNFYLHGLIESEIGFDSFKEIAMQLILDQEVEYVPLEVLVEIDWLNSGSIAFNNPLELILAEEEQSEGGYDDGH